MPLLQDEQDIALFDLHLHIMGKTKIQFPPIPGFHRTIGAVEFPLLALPFGLALGGFLGMGPFDGRSRACASRA